MHFNPLMVDLGDAKASKCRAAESSYGEDVKKSLEQRQPSKE